MSPRTNKQNEDRREDTRRRLLSAAVDRFARSGFDGASTADVARDAGMSHGALFVHFPAKEALFRAAVLDPLPGTLALIERLTAAPGEPADRIRALAHTMLVSFAREESYLTLIQYVMRMRDRFPDLYAEIDAFITSALSHLAAVIREGQANGAFLPGDPARHAFFVYALLQGCGLMRRAPHTDPVWDEAVEAALRLIAAPQPPSGMQGA